MLPASMLCCRLLSSACRGSGAESRYTPTLRACVYTAHTRPNRAQDAGVRDARWLCCIVASHDNIFERLSGQSLLRFERNEREKPNGASEQDAASELMRQAIESRRFARPSAQRGASSSYAAAARPNAAVPPPTFSRTVYTFAAACVSFSSTRTRSFT